jgi:hypothetical protein
MLGCAVVESREIDPAVICLTVFAGGDRKTSLREILALVG